MGPVRSAARGLLTQCQRDAPSADRLSPFRSPSPCSHSATLLLIVLVAAPLAALAGILLFVAWNVDECHQFSRSRLRRFTLGYRVIRLGTFFLTVVFD